MSYEYNLRGLFRPKIDQLPLLEQVPHYYQRDLASSHLYRLGTDLFGGSGIKTRRRLIDASLYSPPLVPQRTSKNSLDSTSPPSRVPHNKQCNAVLRTSDLLLASTKKRKPDVKNDSGYQTNEDFTKRQYQQWLEERRRIHMHLDGLSAYKCWLLTKDRSPIENNLLFNLKSSRRCVSDEVPNVKLSKVTLEHNIERDTEQEPVKCQLSLKQWEHVLQELAFLEQNLITHRDCLVRMLASADKLSNKCISVNDMLSILRKIDVPLSQNAVKVLLEILKKGDNDGLLNYSLLLDGGILRKVEQNFQQLGFEPLNRENSDLNVEDDLHLKKYSQPSSMNGKNGALTDKRKQEELKQFTSLMVYCKENGTALNQKLAEKALLLPADHTVKECMQSLRQPGLDLLSCHFADPPEKEREQTKRKIPSYEGWGRPYKEVRGRKKSNYIRLCTGRVKIEPKTDCWLTYRDYLKLTEGVRSRPGFKYKEHSLADSSAFWPGSMLDKLRLWLPHETLQDKPYSLLNIFQPVKHHNFYNPTLPLVTQRDTWPDNDSRYVQFGSQSRKQYHI